jgi:ATPase subunit of ABC transporter with duplicated ATPase domains
MDALRTDADTPIKNLSGGIRVALCAFTSTTWCLLLEPTNHLDAEAYCG